MRLPRHVTVGPFCYRVRTGRKAVAALADTVGEAHPFDLTILVNTSGAPTAVAETLLHEVLHAAWDMTPLRDFDKTVEESVVAALSPILFGVLRDNPALVAALTDA